MNKNPPSERAEEVKKVTMGVMRFEYDRKTGKTENLGIIGTKEVLDEVYKEGLVALLTGMSIDDCIKEIKKSVQQKENMYMSGDNYEPT